MNASYTSLSSSTTEDLNSVFAIDSDTAFACGDNGTVIYTVDNGATWMDASPDPGMWGTTDLHDLYFFDGKKGMVVGENGTILWTNNSGQNWALITSGTMEDLNAVDFAAKVGFIAGDDGTILKNNDVTIPPFSITEDALSRIRFFPNPARTTLTFTNLPQESIQVEVIDHLGQIVHSDRIGKGISTLDVGNLIAGHYVLKFRVNAQESSIPLVILR